MKQHLDAMEAQLRMIGESQGGEALCIAARDILYAACSVLATVSGVRELARSIDRLPEALLQGSVAKADELVAHPIRTPRQLLN